MSPFSGRRPTPDAVDPLLPEQRDQQFSYPEVGATAGAFPERYPRVRHTIELGHGREVFTRAAEGLRDGRHTCAPASRCAHPTQRRRKGLAVVLTVPVAALYVTVACRAVYVVEQPTRWASPPGRCRTT